MQEARLGSDMLRDRGEEGDHVVLHLALDLIDTGRIEAAALPQRVGRMFRDKTEIGHGLCGIGLDLEPDAELRLGLPNASHFGAAIARDHTSVGAFPREGDRFSRFRGLALPTPLSAPLSHKGFLPSTTHGDHYHRRWKELTSTATT